MGIKQPIVASIAHRTWCIDEYGMTAMYLLEGDEFALLIDTGLGLFDLTALVRQYTDKPLLVALTHGHVDHAGGIGQLEESAVNLHMRGLYNVLRSMKILPGEAVTAEAVREYPNFVWLHTPEKGFYVSCVKAGSCS